MPASGGKHAKAGSWTAEEDELLAEWQSKVGNKWAEVARRIPGRTGQQCAQRWRHKVNPNIRKEKWSEAEDNELTRLYYLHGNAWAEISRHMNGRTDQQCMGRWRRHLDPAIKRDAWKEKEDSALSALYIHYGNQWSVIARQIPGRTAQQCRVRWYQTEASQDQQSQNRSQHRDDSRTPQRNPKQGSKKQSSQGTDQSRADSDSEGTDFEAEYLIKARVRRQSDPRRLPSVMEIREELSDDISSVEGSIQDQATTEPRSCGPEQSAATPAGSAKRVASIRKRTRNPWSAQKGAVSHEPEIPIQGFTPSSNAPEEAVAPAQRENAFEETADAQAAPNLPTAVAAATACERDQKEGFLPLGGRVGIRLDRQTRELLDPSHGTALCQEQSLEHLSPAAAGSFQVASSFCGRGELQSGNDRLAGAPPRGPPNRLPSHIPADLQTSQAAGPPVSGPQLFGSEAGPCYEEDSPPLLSQQSQLMPSDSQILTSTHFNLMSPDRKLLSPDARCLAEITPQQSSQAQLKKGSESQTPLTGTKRPMPGRPAGDGYIDRSREAWEYSPTENALNLFRSPHGNRERSNPLQSPSFQSLATPEWAKRDWCSPAAPGSRSRRGATPGHCQAELATAGKPLNRGPVARKLDVGLGIPPAQSARVLPRAQSLDQVPQPCMHQDSPAKKQRSSRSLKCQEEKDCALPSTNQEQPEVPLFTDKENSACNALKQLSMAAVVTEHSNEETSSAETHWLSPPCPPLDKAPTRGRPPSPEGKLPIGQGKSKTPTATPSKFMLERSDAVRSRLHALLDDL